MEGLLFITTKTKGDYKKVAPSDLRYLKKPQFYSVSFPIFLSKWQFLK